MKYTTYRTEFAVIIFLYCFQLISSTVPINISKDTSFGNASSPLIPSISESDSISITDISNPSLKLQPFQTPSILYIISRLVDFTPEELYEAFWVGIDEKVKILIPASSL